MPVITGVSTEPAGGEGLGCCFRDGKILLVILCELPPAAGEGVWAKAVGTTWGRLLEHKIT